MHVVGGACVACPAGSSSTRAVCERCPAHSYAAAGAACAPCTNATHYASADQGACLRCEGGVARVDVERDVCVHCARGEPVAVRPGYDAEATGALRHALAAGDALCAALLVG